MGFFCSFSDPVLHIQKFSLLREIRFQEVQILFEIENAVKGLSFSVRCFEDNTLRIMKNCLYLRIFQSLILSDKPLKQDLFVLFIGKRVKESSISFIEERNSFSEQIDHQGFK